MKSRANITRKNVETDKEEYCMTYTIIQAETEDELVKIKKAIDKVIVKAGGQTTLDEEED